MHLYWVIGGNVGTAISVDCLNNCWKCPKANIAKPNIRTKNLLHIDENFNSRSHTNAGVANSELKNASRAGQK